MRKIFLFMLVSVDGYFEGPGHDLSWHNVDGEFGKFADEQLGQIGTLLFGRTTYDMMASWWTAAQGVTAKLMNEKPKIVVSHGPFTPVWNNTDSISGDIIPEIKRLKETAGEDIAIFGSNELCVSLMEEGLVDEFRIMVNPVALGSGSQLFTGLSKRIKLKLVKVREFQSGNVLHYYILK